MQKFGVGPARVLNSAVGMMQEAPEFGLAISNGHLKRLDGKACSEMGIQAHSTHLAAERVQDNGKEGKLLSQMHEGDIGNP
ncbi:hypothetical protein [Mesorhizobium sp. M0129]|uniref:hypothetical protein n=1 Tax=Mesorhizobium sp. M0129 TaxID=2956886 RepID=UPI00333BF3AC